MLHARSRVVAMICSTVISSLDTGATFLTLLINCDERTVSLEWRCVQLIATVVS
jgi:hypothetical protein